MSIPCNMRGCRYLLAFMLSLGFSLSSCQESEPARIAWDYSSQTDISPKGGYARVISLPDGTYMAAYDSSGAVHICRSMDEGCTWTDSRTVIDGYWKDGVKVNAANAEIIRLSDGTLLCGANFRPSRDEVESWSIAVARSQDGGRTWTEPQVIYRAGQRFCDGCWEPYFLEMPDSKVHVYFANEAPYGDSSEQEISCMESSDGGCTWGAFRTVSFRKGHRDGMPSARVFGDEIVVAIEDNAHGEFVPYTVRCTLKDAWKRAVGGDSEDRDYALADSLHMDRIYAGAPYLLRLPSGEAAMSYQRSYAGQWNKALMEVAVGDRHARNFCNPTRPFKVPDTYTCLWNSITVLDDHTIAAVGSLSYPKYRPVFKKGYLMYGLELQEGEVVSMPFFVGAEGPANLRSGISYDSGTINICVKVSDASAAADDGVFVYLDASGRAVPSERSMRLRVGRDGESGLSRWYGGEWRAAASAGFSVEVDDDDRSYTAYIRMEKSLVGRVGLKGLRFGLSLCAYDDDGRGYCEDMVHMDPDDPSTWIRLER